MADNQMHAGGSRATRPSLPRRRGKRDRLLDQHMLAVTCGEPYVFGMILMWRGDIDDLDIGISAECGN